MCLAVPAKLVQRCDEQTAVADLHGNCVEVNTMLVPEAVVGDWVLIHAGFAIEQLDEEQAGATWSVLGDLQTCAEKPDDDNAQ